MPIERIVILDDNDSWGGPGVLVEYNQEKISETALKEFRDSSEVDGLVKEVEDGKTGRILDINALVDLYDAVRTCPDDLVLTPQIWEALGKVDRT